MKKIISICLVSILALTCVRAPTALGCAISSGDPWFSVKPAVVDNPLADSLEISFSEDGSLVTFVDKNLAGDVYIASKDTDGIYPGYDQSRKDYRPADKVVGHEFEPNILISTGTTMPKGIYEFYGGWGQTNIRDNGDKNSGTTSLSRALDSSDNYSGKQVVGDNRPDNVTVPTPDRQTMYAFYQGTRYDINIVLSYALNKNYDADATKNSCSGDGAIRQTGAEDTLKNSDKWLLPLLLVVSIVVIIGIIALRMTRPKRSKQPVPKNKSKK